jgi:nucleotide-binding universal stress UspA family protein
MKILVAMDFSDCSRLACRWAVQYAQRLGAQELTFLNVIEPGASADRIPEIEAGAALLRELVAEEVQNALGTERLSSVLQLRYSVKQGTPTEEIVAAARDMKMDALVMGTHGRKGFDRLLVGSVAEKVLRDAPCTVIIVKPKAGS